MTVQCYAGALRRFFTYVEDVDRTFHLGAIFDLTTERQMILSATHVTEFQQQHPGSAALQLDKAMKQFLMFLAKFRLESSNTAEEARLDRVEKMEGHIRETLQQSKRGQDKSSARTKSSNDAGKHDRDHLSCRPDAVQNMLRKLIQCPTLSQEINIILLRGAEQVQSRELTAPTLRNMCLGMLLATTGGQRGNAFLNVTLGEWLHAKPKVPNGVVMLQITQHKTGDFYGPLLIPLNSLQTRQLTQLYVDHGRSITLGA
jgi:hypothetical protein